MIQWLYWESGSSAGTVNGPPPTSDCQPTCKPIAWLVLPAGDILSTNVFMADQSALNCFAACGQEPYWSATYSDAHRGVTGSGASAVVSKLYVASGPSQLPRSITQPFHVLWLAGVQVPGVHT